MKIPTFDLTEYDRMIEVAEEAGTLLLQTDPATRCCEGKDCYEFVAGVLEIAFEPVGGA